MNFSISNIYENKNKVFNINNNEFNELMDIIDSYNIKCTNNFDRTFLLEYDDNYDFGFEKDNTVLNECMDKWLKEKTNITCPIDRVYNIMPVGNNMAILKI